ncbi:MAG: hypothetical protein ACLGH2_08935 [Gammaproteobacteria bacterium]
MRQYALFGHSSRPGTGDHAGANTQPQVAPIPVSISPFWPFGNPPSGVADAPSALDGRPYCQ